MFLTRLALLILVSVATPLFISQTASIVMLVLALGGEWLGRWLFFVSVVPKNTGAAFTGRLAA